ncbi:BMC domain-containing protein [Paenibacillus aceris]|uniref:Microcompartment protein CcmL/EutN n=1 Tax=Paenibacillus aceris TaxID=869555 RepID=A0ABS4I6A8_9BACL|nr:BMC domain-containing protein [Paenibacillus aceris]MBP1966452.1 microcompartment protein CcmL/EutN [Paenibacillus aceris]NHW39568.1 BMC domain-containing protein [Paenibacillus aceris]
MDGQKLSLGMIETYGLPALIAAADAAAKTADVKVTMYEKVDAGIVTVYIWGDVAAVKAAVDAGAAEATRVGKLLGTQVIPRPDPSVYTMLQGIGRKDPPQASAPETRKQEEPPATTTNWNKMTVAQLRELAHSTSKFPLSGRDIQLVSKAELIRLFTELTAEGGEPPT